MRARYYEPGSGRFISEDPSIDGVNWFAYCSGDPVNKVDGSGRSDHYREINKYTGPIVALSSIVVAAALSPLARYKAVADITFLAAWFSCGVGKMTDGGDIGVLGFILINAAIDLIVICTVVDKYGAEIAKSCSPTLSVVAICLEHAAFLGLFMSLEDIANNG